MELYLLIALLAVALISLVILLSILVKTKKPTDNLDGAIVEEIKTKILELESELRKTVEESNSRQAQAISNSFVNTNKLVLDNLGRFLAQLEKGNADTVSAINQNLEKINKSVNEQLSENLQKRLDSSYSKVSESLERIHKWLGEMQELTTGVTDLKRVLTGVKTRGNWGETSLEAILEQILTVEQYKKQVQISGQNMVDFAVLLPGKDCDKVLLPIDAKFPIEDYARLCEAQEVGDNQAVERYRKELVARVKHEAIQIRDKYVKAPKTTDFAIMYVPTEGLFAELLRSAGLSEELQKNKVVLAGPTTVTALLNSLRMGFKTLAIEKRSTEIAKLLASFQREFGYYMKNLSKTKSQLDTARTSLDDVVHRSEKIQARLQKVEVLPGEGEDTQDDYEV